LAVRALAQTLNYGLCLASKPANSLVGLAMAEMTDMASQGLHCWLTRTDKMARLLNLPDIRYSKFFGQYVLKKVQCRLDRYWLDEISSTRVGPDGNQHNNLLTYSTLKGFFGREPYVTMCNNRNQQCHLFRLIVSAQGRGVS
jgi:hypothetical protein